MAPPARGFGRGLHGHRLGRAGLRCLLGPAGDLPTAGLRRLLGRICGGARPGAPACARTLVRRRAGARALPSPPEPSAQPGAGLRLRGLGGVAPPEVVEERLERGLRDAERPPEDVARDFLPGLLTESAPEAMVEEVLAVMADFHPAGLRSMAHAFAEADLRDMLPSIAVPTLLLYGDADVRSPLFVAAALHEQIPGSELVVMDGVPHLSNVEAAERFNAEGARIPGDPGRRPGMSACFSAAGNRLISASRRIASERLASSSVHTSSRGVARACSGWPCRPRAGRAACPGRSTSRSTASRPRSGAGRRRRAHPPAWQARRSLRRVSRGRLRGHPSSPAYGRSTQGARLTGALRQPTQPQARGTGSLRQPW